jgi:hypothetical protein
LAASEATTKSECFLGGVENSFARETRGLAQERFYSVRFEFKLPFSENRMLRDSEVPAAAIQEAKMPAEHCRVDAYSFSPTENLQTAGFRHSDGIQALQGLSVQWKTTQL